MPLQVPVPALRLMAANMDPPTAGELGSTAVVVHLDSKDVLGLSHHLLG